MFRSVRARTIALSCSLAALSTLVLPSAAAAQGLGVRAGASVDPDQFYVGGHYETGALVERLHFRPNLEVGFGDDLTALGFNLEFVYKVPIDGPWTLYAGGGPALNVYSFNDETETDGGVNVLFGAETSNGLFFEVKVGAIDSPDVKFGIGYTWRR
jgi:hypothetical protein